LADIVERRINKGGQRTMKIGKWNVLFTKDDELAWQIKAAKEGRSRIFFTSDKKQIEQFEGIINGTLFTTHGPGKKVKPLDTRMLDEKMQAIDAQAEMQKAYEGNLEYEKEMFIASKEGNTNA
jgi:hypothetical protein